MRRCSRLNLKNGQITVGELLQNPAARKLFHSFSPISVNSPVVRAARGMTLHELVRKARSWMTQEQINEILEELQRA